MNDSSAKLPEAASSPENCETMVEVRAGVDATDREIVALLERRFGYMRAAARIKPTREAVRDEERKASVIAAAVAEAEARSLPVELIAELWEQLVEGSIAYEFGHWDKIRD
ncbi:MAG: chorismate mutase [Erythrobacter sp.]|uniref:chorismate mutase n=1 Tax=Erythrobacter sp. TaxID=1042 RepID=UPI00326628E8